MKFFSRLFADAVIRIRGGSAHCVKGKMLDWQLGAISTIAADAGLEAGEIWVDGSGGVGFSKEIPKEVHQGIRNVIASQ